MKIFPASVCLIVSMVIVSAPGRESSDKYSKIVRQLEAGRTDVDYTEFRLSFLESEQFKTIADRKPDLDTLRKELHQLMRKSKYPEVISTGKKMLDIDYTDMEAHKVLRQTYKMLGDGVNEKKHHDIEFGLLNSIVKKGDGKSCETAWPVIQITEEYFVLEMIGARLLGQSLETSGGLCDRMEVQTEEGKKTYYFEVTRVFEGYKKHGIN